MNNSKASQGTCVHENGGCFKIAEGPTVYLLFFLASVSQSNLSRTELFMFTIHILREISIHHSAWY